MTLDEEMALAVLKGEKGTALILAQKLIEEHVGGRVEVPPIKLMEIPAGRKKLIFTLDTKLIVEGSVEINNDDIRGMMEEASRWLKGEINTLVSVGFIPHLFVEPEQPPEPQVSMGVPRMKSVVEAQEVLAKLLRETDWGENG